MRLAIATHRDLERHCIADGKLTSARIPGAFQMKKHVAAPIVVANESESAISEHTFHDPSALLPRHVSV
jgi:hypothetical protein